MLVGRSTKTETFVPLPCDSANKATSTTTPATRCAMEVAWMAATRCSERICESWKPIMETTRMAAMMPKVRRKPMTSETPRSSLARRMGIGRWLGLDGRMVHRLGKAEGEGGGRGERERQAAHAIGWGRGRAAFLARVLDVARVGDVQRGVALQEGVAPRFREVTVEFQTDLVHHAAVDAQVARRQGLVERMLEVVSDGRGARVLERLEAQGQRGAGIA